MPLRQLVRKVIRVVVTGAVVVGLVAAAYLAWDRLSRVSRADLEQIVRRDGLTLRTASIPPPVIDRLASHRVVLLGEHHFLKEHRELVAELLRELHARGFRQYLFEWTQAADWLLADYVTGGRLAPEFKPPHDIGGHVLAAIRDLNLAVPDHERTRGPIWRQPALVILPRGAPPLWTERAMLAVPVIRPLSARLLEDARILVRLGRILASESPPAPPPSRAALDLAATSDLILRLLAGRDTADPEHPLRVRRLALLLAQRTGQPAEAHPALEQAALWHDVGKLAIHPGVLHRDGPLSARDRAAVREHPVHVMDLVRQMFGADLAALGGRQIHDDGTGN